MALQGEPPARRHFARRRATVGRVFGDAVAYERFMGRWSARLAPRFLDELGMPDPARVVDVGCGTGNLARAVAERWTGCEVVGVDPSRAVRHGGARARRPAHPPGAVRGGGRR